MLQLQFQSTKPKLNLNVQNAGLLRPELKRHQLHPKLFFANVKYKLIYFLIENTPPWHQSDSLDAIKSKLKMHLYAVYIR